MPCWWTWRELNSLPLPCEGSALPVELQAHGFSRTGGNRTLYLLRVEQVLCQMSYGPKLVWIEPTAS